MLSRFAIILCLIFGVNAWGEGLKWAQTSVDLLVGVGDKKGEAVYAFTNTGTTPIEIRQVQTSCGCTTAALPKKEYGPGETGELKVVFVYGNRKGQQTKTVFVETSESGNAPTILKLRANIPDPIAFNPPQLSWEVGAPNEFKEVAAVAGEAHTAVVESAEELKGNFEVKSEEVENGKRYRIKVRPLTTERAVKGAVRLKISDPGRRSLFLPVEVRDPS